jgi:hypothetical protein
LLHNLLIVFLIPSGLLLILCSHFLLWFGFSFLIFLKKLNLCPLNNTIIKKSQKLSSQSLLSILIINPWPLGK